MSRLYNKSNTVALSGCGYMIAFFLILYIPCVYFTNRNLDFWLSYIKGTEVDVPLWISMVISLFEPILLLDIIGEICRLYIS